MERGRGETRMLEQNNRSQVFAKGIGRRDGADTTCISNISGTAGPEMVPQKAIGASNQGAGGADGWCSPPARPHPSIPASRASDWRGIGTKAAEKAFGGRDGLGSAPEGAFWGWPTLGVSGSPGPSPQRFLPPLLQAGAALPCVEGGQCQKGSSEGGCGAWGGGGRGEVGGWGGAWVAPRGFPAHCAKISVL